MKILLALALALCWIPSATAQPAPEDKIVGRWNGLGMNYLTVMIIEKNHTWHDADEPSGSGTWSFQDGQFSLVNAEVTLKGSIDPEGRLILFQPEEPGLKFPFRRNEPTSSSLSIARAPAGPVPQPTGEWRFAYLKKSAIPAAPPFDMIRFVPGGKTQLGFATAARQFDVDCHFTGPFLAVPLAGEKTLTDLLSYIPLGRPASSMLFFAFRLEDDAKTLVLSNWQAVEPFKCEWVFMQPEQFPPNEIVGTWIAPRPGLNQEIEMRKDGVCAIASSNGQKVVAAAAQPLEYYRLWRSPLGNIISVVTMQPDMRLLHVAMMRYEKKNDELVITPVELEFGEKLKLLEAGRETWKLKKNQ